MLVFNPSTGQNVEIQESQIVERSKITNIILTYSTFISKEQDGVGEYHEPNEVAIMDSFFALGTNGVNNLGIIGTPSFQALDKTNYEVSFKEVLPVAYSEINTRYYLQCNVKNISSKNIETGFGKGSITNGALVEVVGSLEYVIFDTTPSKSVTGLDLLSGKEITKSENTLTKQKTINGINLSYLRSSGTHGTEAVEPVEFLLTTLPADKSGLLTKNLVSNNKAFEVTFKGIRKQENSDKSINVYLQYDLLNTGNPVKLNLVKSQLLLGVIEYSTFNK